MAIINVNDRRLRLTAQQGKADAREARQSAARAAAKQRGGDASGLMPPPPPTAPTARLPTAYAAFDAPRPPTASGGDPVEGAAAGAVAEETSSAPIATSAPTQTPEPSSLADTGPDPSATPTPAVATPSPSSDRDGALPAIPPPGLGDPPQAGLEPPAKKPKLDPVPA